MSNIAIVSESYCSGEDIARRVAERLEYTLVGQEFCDMVSQKYGISTSSVKRAMSNERTLLGALTQDHDKTVVYVRAALSEMLVQQYLVHHGMAARLIPKSISHVLRVGIVGERSFRVGSAVAQEGIAEKEANRLVDQTDERRSEWAHQHLGDRFWDPDYFDVIIPRPAKSVAEAVDLIVDAISQITLRPTDRSVGAQLDFLLAAKVGVALLERGKIRAEVSATDGSVVVKLRSKRSPTGQLTRAVHALRQESRTESAYEICRAIKGVQEVLVVPTALPARTLIVDDERDYVVTLSERLQTRNIVADMAFDGQQALDTVDAEEPAVIVLDLKMPGLDGLEVLERVRRDHPRVRVIVVTGHGSKQAEERARALGAYDFLEKPVDITKLAAKINEARLLYNEDEDASIRRVQAAREGPFKID